MFKKVVVDNFTSFSHFEFDLIENKTDKKAKNLAIIYGENGIGKTCLVKTFDFLVQTFISLIGTEELAKIINNTSGTQNNPIAPFIGATLSEQKVSRLVKKYRRINSTGKMKTVYECLLNKSRYVYSMTFDDKAIVSEKLLCDGVLLFSCSRTKIFLSENTFTDAEFNKKLVSSFNMYFGENYTFLSCIFSERRKISPSFFKQALSRDIVLFLDMLSSMTVVTKDNQIDFGNNYYSQDFLNPIVSGRYTQDLQNRLQKTQTALSMFFSSLYSNIHSLEYHIDTNVSGEQTYHLFFVEDNGNERIPVPYEVESTGTRKLVTLFTSLFDVSTNNKIIIIDEIDNGINDIMLKNILGSLEDNINGQLIITTHNTLLLKHSIKKNIYLLDRDEDKNVCAYSLDEFGRKIQPGTDIIGQYLKGLYGGVPLSGAFSMKYIIEALEEYE